MKIPINLASQPFQRVRAMLLASVAVSLLLLATLALMPREPRVSAAASATSSIVPQLTRQTSVPSRMGMALPMTN